MLDDKFTNSAGFCLVKLGVEFGEEISIFEVFELIGVFRRSEADKQENNEVKNW